MRNIFDGGKQIFYQNNAGFTNYTRSTQEKSSSTIITTNADIRQTADYKVVHKVVSDLVESGIGRMGEGYCISVSDILFNILRQKGIQSHLKEVQLSIGSAEEIRMVGFDTSFDKSSQEAVATHVVVITDTEIPMLVDLAIAHRLPGNYQAIIEKAQDHGDKVIATVQKDGTNLLYQEKLEGKISVPQLHQISILQRMQTDKTIFKTLNTLKILNIIGILLSTFALINVFGKIFLDWYN